MAKTKPKQRKTPTKAKGEMDMAAIRKVELVPDAWPRFERLVKSAGELGHKTHAGRSKKHV